MVKRTLTDSPGNANWHLKSNALHDRWLDGGELPDESMDGGMVQLGMDRNCRVWIYDRLLAPECVDQANSPPEDSDAGSILLLLDVAGSFFHEPNYIPSRRRLLTLPL